MKKTNDYTLNGRLSCTTWTGFIAECKSRGIDITGRKFVDLEAEMLKVLDAETAQAAVVEETAPTAMDTNKFVVDGKLGDAIIKRLMLGGKDRNGKSHRPSVFMGTKAKDPDNIDRLMITMKHLFGVIGDVYGLDAKDESSKETIHAVINTFCRIKMLRYKKYDTGAVVFYPTEKMAYRAIELSVMSK